jgi:nitric oxide reductase large subunit
MVYAPSYPLSAAFVFLLLLVGLIAGYFFRYAVTSIKAGKQRTVSYTLIWMGTTIAVFVLLLLIGELNRTRRIDETLKWIGIGLGVAGVVFGYFYGRFRR